MDNDDNNNKLTARKTTATTIRHYAVIAKLVKDCYEEEDIDKKIKIPYKINSTS
jgi:hypothetical protein